MKDSKLVIKYLPYIEALVTKATTNLPCWLDRSDIVMDATLAVLKIAPKFDAKHSSFKTFVYKRVIGSVTDGLRDRKLYGPSRKNYVRVKLKDIPAPSDAIEVDAPNVVKDILATLNDNHLAVIKLRYFNDMSQAAIGIKRGVSYGRISQIEKQALLKMRKALTERGIYKLSDVL